MIVSAAIETPFISNPMKQSARRSFRFCVPDEWYRRSKPRLVNPPPEPSDGTIKHLADSNTPESDGESSTEGEGTAKQKNAGTAAKASERPISPDFSSQSRLSNLYGWLGAPASPSQTRASAIFTPEHVSEPKLVRHLTGGSRKSDISDHADEPMVDSYAFEQMLVC